MSSDSSPVKLNPEQRARLKAQLQQRGLTRQQSRTISPQPQGQPLPLSYAQELMWLLDQLAAPAYNTPLTWCIRGPLDVALLERCLQVVIQRHEVLRTVYQWQDDQLQQGVLPEVAFAIAIADLRQIPAAEQSAQAHTILLQETRRPFDLARDIPLRATVLHLGEGEYWLHFTWHHIASDDTSQAVLLKELSALYSALTQGSPSPLTPLPIQYGDYAYWQRQQLTETVLSADLAYWRRQLAHLPPKLALPFRNADRENSTSLGQAIRVPFTLDSALATGLKALSRQHRITLFTTLLTAFNVLLYRYSGQTDIVVGIPFSDRIVPEVQPLLGVFTNTLVLRADLTDAPRFTTLLTQVNAALLAAREHQALPYAQLVTALREDSTWSPGWDGSTPHSDLFQVLFDFQSVPLPQIELPDLTVSPLENGLRCPLVDLTLHLEDNADGLSGYVIGADTRFEVETLQQMVGHWQTLLMGIMADPAQTIDTLPLLTSLERHQYWLEGQASAPVHPSTQRVHHGFEVQAERTPDAIALLDGTTQQTLTYGELNRRANQLAHHLRQLGVQAETPVGLCCDRSLDMIVGLLGILKAGGAYLPLDPHYPQTRLQFILANAEPVLILTQRQTAAVLPTSSIPRLCLDQDAATIVQHPTHNPEPVGDAQTLAYVIYTSGSTGKPKGVMIEHGALANFVTAAIQLYGVQGDDRVLQFASLSFDAAAEEMYPCLLTGGTLVLRSDAMISSPSQFVNTCQDWHITVLDLPTAYWQQIVAELAAESLTLPPCLRLVIIGGERVPPAAVHTWWTCVGKTPQLINTYGPTETTVVATACSLNPDTVIQPEVPIGRAIANLQTHVLDAQLHPVPIGIPGELYISGAGLARGYLNRPELTRERFMTHTPEELPSTRLYRTGDLVRYRRDGQLEFLGRVDHQVKIRGFRVELGEIEAALLQHQGVKTAIAVVREDQPGDRRLVVYGVPASGELSPSQIREVLKTKLPDYMVPSAVVFLETLPLTPNGKVDRKALPAPDPSQRRRDAPLVEPRSDTEATLTAIWRDVLKVEALSIHDNFFELGGHSLLATRVASRISQAFSLNFLLRNLFEAPTIAELAGRVAALLQAQSIHQKPTMTSLEEGEL
jgi:amino acid adenylation domain-containing protein